LVIDKNRDRTRSNCDQSAYLVTLITRKFDNLLVNRKLRCMRSRRSERTLIAPIWNGKQLIPNRVDLIFLHEQKTRAFELRNRVIY